MLALTLYTLCNRRRKFFKLKTYSLDGISELIPEDYQFSTIKVTTDDGYVLSLFNLRHIDNYLKSKDPVLFQHGMAASAANWLMGGGENSPACILAKQG